MHSIISEQQSAFIPGRQIQDNIVVAHEVFHFLKHKKVGKKASVAIKLDLNKAYDSVCWDFLLRLLNKMGFDEKWISWIEQCVCSVSYSFFLNGSQICNVLPDRGLRQGDPLSPYLFLMVADVFSLLLNKAVSNKTLMGIKMKKKCPMLSHLFFADDSLIFLEANPKCCLNFMEVAKAFSEATGLSINAHKSSAFFSANSSSQLKGEILGVLGMKEMDPATQYLGLPAFWGSSKKEAMGFIKDKIMSKVRGWANKQLNQAGKEVLIKSVLQTIPMYAFMVFKVPNTLCSTLNSVISKFWWENGDNGGKIHWGSKLSNPKGMGGMGFKDFASFNLALLAKQFWRLISNPSSLWSKVLKGLYFPNKAALDAGRGAQPSWVWSSLLEGRNLLKEGLMWSVGNGDSINFWQDVWVPGLSNSKLSNLSGSSALNTKVADFVDFSTLAWDQEKLQGLVLEEELREIQKIPISFTNRADKLIWRHTSSGSYTVKSGYLQAAKKMRPISNQPSSSFSPSKEMWTRLWNIPTIPKVRLFMWKVVKNWIACKENLFRKKCAHNPLCPICEEENESIEHILFRCPWTKTVWIGSGKAFWTQTHPVVSADKWMEDLLCGSLAKETDIDTVGALFQLCWAIWKARNEWVFNGIKPKPEEVIYRASIANSDYLLAMFSSPTVLPTCKERSGKWVPPLPSVVKFNIDGAYNSSRSSAALGIVARDRSGSALVWRCGKVIASSAIFTEAWALRIACQLAMEMGFSEVVFESDCLELITCLHSGNSAGPWEIRAVIDDLKFWSSSFKWSFVWCNREKNKAAHWLATKCLQKTILVNTGCLPPDFEEILCKDLE